MFKWITAFWQWLAEARIAILLVLVLAAAGLLGFGTWFSTTSIFLAGFVLQLLGMIFTIKGLMGVRTHFKHKPFQKLLVAWLKQFPKWNRPRIVGAISQSLSLATSKAHVQVWTTDDPSQPVENRIDGVISNLERLREEQGKHAVSIDSLHVSHEKHKKHLTVENEKLQKEFQSELESLHTSDLSTSLVGLVWLTVGITMSAMAPYLYKWVQ